MTQKKGYDYFLQNALKYGWMIPQGAILMWHGSIATIPSGWTLCNGSNDTPDLRDMFIVGAKQDDAGVAKTNISGALTQSGGEATHTLTDTEMPNHAHVHDNVAQGEVQAGSGSGGYYNSQYNPGGFVTNTTGGSEAHNNVPPYYALAFIMKT